MLALVLCQKEIGYMILAEIHLQFQYYKLDTYMSS